MAKSDDSMSAEQKFDAIFGGPVKSSLFKETSPPPKKPSPRLISENSENDAKKTTKSSINNFRFSDAMKEPEKPKKVEKPKVEKNSKSILPSRGKRNTKKALTKRGKKKDKNPDPDDDTPDEQLAKLPLNNKLG